MYNKIRRITISTKLQFFQYRILNKVLTTNVKRHMWNSQKSPLCHWCREEQETVLHLFVYCKVIQRIWRVLSKWLKYFFNIDLVFTDRMIILNNYDGPQGDLINMYILVVKQYIYAKKCLNENLQFAEISDDLTSGITPTKH